MAGRDRGSDGRVADMGERYEEGIDGRAYRRVEVFS